MHIVIPDIHNKYWIVDKLLHKLAPKVTQGEALHVDYLGDYWDDWDDDYQSALDMAKWLKRRIDKPPVIDGVQLVERFKLGNHDMPYLYPELRSATACSGFTEDKSVAIHAIFEDIQYYREKFKLSDTLGSWLLTHAGFMNYWVNKYWGHDLPPVSAQTLNDLITELKTGIIDAGMMHPLIGAGIDRNGRQEVGGITWAGWEYFSPVSGVNQIVGHTQAKHVRERTCINRPEPCRNICIDTRLRNYAVYDPVTDDFKVHSI